jgi:hypothetical protein
LEDIARVRALLVELFDRRDGTGADWRLLLESLYRAGFGIMDERPDDEARQALLRRVYEEAEVRLTGGYADGSGPSKADAAGADLALSNTGVSVAPRPKPPS